MSQSRRCNAVLLWLSKATESGFLRNPTSANQETQRLEMNHPTYAYDAAFCTGVCRCFARKHGLVSKRTIWKHCKSHSTLALLALHRRACSAEGSDTRTHTALWLGTTAGRSDGVLIWIPLNSRIREPTGMKMPCTGETRMAFELSAERNAGHSRALTEIMQPGGECRSEYSGAS